MPSENINLSNEIFFDFCIDFFKLLTDKLMAVAADYCDNRILSMLEGGYDIQALEQSMIIHLKELQK